MTDEGGAPGAHAIYGARYAWTGLSDDFGSVPLGRYGMPSEFYLGFISPFSSTASSRRASSYRLGFASLICELQFVHHAALDRQPSGNLAAHSGQQDAARHFFTVGAYRGYSVTTLSYRVSGIGQAED